MLAEVEADQMKVLVVDDELGPRESLRMLLKKKYEVECAENVDKALGMLKDMRPDVVIMDISMPGKNGIQGLQELRQLDKQAAVVMLTGFGTLETAQEALRHGANDYINKPFDTSEMMDLVDRFSRQSRMERRRARVVKDLQEMNSRLMEDVANKDHLATLGQSSAEFAHDLRNPLMIVRGYVDLLNEQLDRARTMEGGEYGDVSNYLTIIEQNVERCCDLASMWQKLGKSDSGQFQEIPITQIFEDVMMSIEPLIAALDVEIEYQVSHNEGTLLGSRAQLLRAIHNLVSNSIDAVDPVTGRIVLECHEDGEKLYIQVKDNGCGMPNDVVERFFQPYFTTKANGKGTGLGTAISKRIVEEHDGTISVESTVDKGTKITITLPLSKQQ